MSRAYVIVEGEGDKKFLDRVLEPSALADVKTVVAGGKGQISSLARSLVARRRTPVAVLMDADSTNPQAIEDSRQETEELIRLAGASVPIKVLTVIPEIEAWFFASPDAVERMAGPKITEEMLALGRFAPKEALRRWTQGKKQWTLEQAVDDLDDSDIKRIRALPEVTELSDFLKNASSGTPSK